jgi:hypothetical protein
MPEFYGPKYSMIRARAPHGYALLAENCPRSHATLQSSAGCEPELLRRLAKRGLRWARAVLPAEQHSPNLRKAVGDRRMIRSVAASLECA